MATLDPDPTNELGCGVLDPAVESFLLAQGVIYAHTVITASGRKTIASYKRPLRSTLESEVTSRAKALKPSQRRRLAV